MKRKKRRPPDFDERSVDPSLTMTREDSPSLSGESRLARTQLLHSLREVNARCVDTLVEAARADCREALPLVNHLRDLLRGLTPAVRSRAAGTTLLLVDMQLSNADWWRLLKMQPTRAAPLPPGRGNFPKASAVHLGRAALVLAWHSVRADLVGSCLLGVSAEVAQIIASFSLTDLDRIVERRFRYVRPRWEDRPAAWRALILSAQSGDPRRTRDANLRALQLMTGDLLSARVPWH